MSDKDLVFTFKNPLIIHRQKTRKRTLTTASKLKLERLKNLKNHCDTQNLHLETLRKCVNESKTFQQPLNLVSKFKFVFVDEHPYKHLANFQ